MDKGSKTSIVIRCGKIFRQITIANLICIECNSYVCSLIMTDNDFSCVATLSSFEKKLRPWRFYRISRSVIVNMNHIAAIRSTKNNRHCVVMTNGKEFNIAFRRWNQLKMAFLE